ncbi:hypothetical protein M0R04_11085 [Candidatus Dojkabacteria bacterium]|jgi:hypothetical protein|nr:hypothetical protein [Candidatus Dojkabacteria bacterium]
MVKIGDKIRILNQDGQYSKWVKQIWIVEHIATSEQEHQGYDRCIGGNLISCKDLPVSLYDWEFEVMVK